MAPRSSRRQQRAERVLPSQGYLAAITGCRKRDRERLFDEVLLGQGAQDLDMVVDDGLRYSRYVIAAREIGKLRSPDGIGGDEWACKRHFVRESDGARTLRARR